MGDTDIQINKEPGESVELPSKSIKETCCTVDKNSPENDTDQSVENTTTITTTNTTTTTEETIERAGDVMTEISTMDRAEQRIPTLFTGSIDATEKPLSRRRHIRRNLFEDEIPTGREIFSYQGKRGVNIQRHRDNVTVFPSGCMGINDKLKEKEENIISPRRYLNPSEMQVPQTRLIGFTPKKRPTSAQPNAIPRNPLTGEGYNDSDFIRHGTLKKKDGNPLLGEGYKDDTITKPGKIPPGGYSTGLW